ncbi:MAG: DUF1572 family protein [Candidatus Zixiibacteriota bacterium]
MINEIRSEFERYRLTGEKALKQVSDDDLNRIVGGGNNSIAMIVRHVGGNLASRFTDFLTTDGEKPWRDRDAEFEDRSYTRAEVMEWWEKGWGVLLGELAKLTDDDMGKSVSIRGIPLTVSSALARSVTHVAYHVGQIVILARMAKAEQWEWITVPRGGSKEYNLNPTKEKKPE